MSRTVREKSGTGIYHVLLRGINRQTIFEDKEDAGKFMQTLGACQEKSGFKLYAYCLMGNHVHLLIKEEKEDLSIVMQRIGASYVYWYNQKYERCGHLFQGRYKSEVVEDDRYFLAVLRYIHKNPVKAGLSNEMADYPWSSYREYIGRCRFVETDLALEIFHKDKEKALEQFKAFHALEEENPFLDIDEKRKLNDEEAIELIKGICQIKHCKELQNLNKEKQSKYLKRLTAEGLSLRQISRITGIGRWAINKLIKKTTSV
ncbi:MAG: REP-associated tyrosine transposase [Dethiobacteria bacterium]|jgi:putative transposase